MNDNAYWMAAADGAVYNFGGAPNFGSMYGHPLNKPIVGMAALPTGKGYWLVASDGGIFTFGTAPYLGSMGGHPLNKPIVGMAATPTGNGYYEVASDGGIFTFGTAQFLGSMGGTPLNKPVVGLAVMPTGGGYWEVASDGGIFTFGKDRFYGSMGGTPLNKPIVGMAATATGHGYWMVASDGGIFTFGGTREFYGSLGTDPNAGTIVGMSPTFTGTGYWLASAAGTVSNFGAAQSWGSAVGVTSPIVAIATAIGTGQRTTPPLFGGAVSYPAGSYGYDVSGYQCGGLPSGAHTIGIVEVSGWSYGSKNPCFTQEVSWAGSGLNLYMFLSYGKSSTPEPGCTSNPTAPTPAACNFGYGAAVHAYQLASSSIGSTANVPWWLDVESDGQWSATSSSNRSAVAGAYAALHAMGISSVGFYFSLSGWSGIVGSYGPADAPLFPAWWGGPTPATKCSDARSVAAGLGDSLPPGPVSIVQYASGPSGTNFDFDYSC